MASLRGSQKGSLWKMIGVSLILHILWIVLFSLNPWPTIVKVRPTAYTVTLMPISVQEPRIENPVPPPAMKEEIPKPAEKPRIEKPKKDDIVQKVKKPQKEKTDLKHLQEAVEEIRKKVALDEIQKRVAKREKTEEKPAIVPPNPSSVPSPKASTRTDSKLNEYYNMIWAKIKEAWTIPENSLKEMVDLETVIVIIIEADGKVQRSWFEKRSGNDLYDQMAMRAIRRAEPLPPIPKELNEKSLEVGIRFLPD